MSGDNNLIIIVTNLPSEIYDNVDMKNEFINSISHLLDSSECVTWLKSFQRVIISSKSAKVLKQYLDNMSFRNKTVQSFMTNSSANDHQYLQVPKAEKQFLISPPSSPPLGWSSIKENGPVPLDEAHADSLENVVNDDFKLEEPSLDTPTLLFAFGNSLRLTNENESAGCKYSDSPPSLPYIAVFDCDGLEVDKSSSAGRFPVSSIPKTRMPANS